MYDLGNLLKQLREEKNVSMDKMIEDLKSLYSISIAKSTISKWENNKADPSMENAKVLCNYFNISLDYLLGLSKFKNKEEELEAHKYQMIEFANKHNKNFKEKKLIDNYNKLNDLGKDKLIEYSNDLIEAPKYLKEDDNKVVELPKEQKREKLQDYFTTIAAHNDDLTEEEKIIAEQKVLEALRKNNLI